MNNIKKEIVRKQKQASRRIDILINGRVFTKKELANKIGISQPTIRLRLIKNNWKLGEIELIMNIYPF